MIRSFDLADQHDFARLSGDENPQHVDPLAARRMLFGETVVHGMHQVLWALDSLDDRIWAGMPAHIKVSFPRPLFVGQKAAISVSTEQDGAVRLDVAVDGIATAVVRLVFGPTREAPKLPPGAPAQRVCRILPIEGVAECAGRVSLPWDVELAARMLPNLVRRMNAADLAALLGLTLLVGMECPGQASVFADFEARFGAGEGEFGILDYRVVAWRANVRRLSMEVRSAGFLATVAAFMPPLPSAAAGIAEIAARVAQGRFTGWDALVAGGSRGLGATAARIIAAGGGRVRLTYSQGAQDAQHLAEELVRAGMPSPDILHLDVTQGLGTVTAPAGLSHCFYFAAPRIRPNPSLTPSPALLDLYRRFFVDGLMGAARWAAQAARPGFMLINPSTVFIDHPERGFHEYAQAKAEGERALAHWEEEQGGRVQVVQPRLPRLATDQALSLIPVKADDPLKVLLPLMEHLADGYSR